MQPILDSINKPNDAPGDYIGPDGLRYCGKCHRAKEAFGTGIMAGKKTNILCACGLAEREAEAERERRKRSAELRKICFPFDSMHGHTFDNAAEAEHIKRAHKYVDNWTAMQETNTGLLFFGNVGTGKSFTAHCIANALIDQGIPVRCLSSVELVAKLMDKETRREEFIGKLCKVPLLIIDDIGAERDTAFSREQLCAVIDARYEAGRPLVVTTNYTMREMDNCQDRALQRIFDRLRAMCVPVGVVGESRRKEIGAAKMARARELLTSS